MGSEFWVNRSENSLGRRNGGGGEHGKCTVWAATRTVSHTKTREV